MGHCECPCSAAQTAVLAEEAAALAETEKHGIICESSRPPFDTASSLSVYAYIVVRCYCLFVVVICCYYLLLLFVVVYCCLLSL